MKIVFMDKVFLEIDFFNWIEIGCCGWSCYLCLFKRCRVVWWYELEFIIKSSEVINIKDGVVKVVGWIFW